ncbi:glycosyltransferase family 1 protein [Tolypothrix sp. FACHB-123]|uniref:glycosyltransferase family protein n=1 Tax=Tolypothrix sp. FACHB-123 TaxID=2692868 RepID=UPI001684289C|nr:glycosyltransferase [Tolypothrix sp. FACHB-123]MBD2355697.1 glycosyltransferase family 1 protein [Tolypothrix sp. FACHB-123]
MQDGSFDPFRKEVLETLSLYASQVKAIITNHFLHNNSAEIKFFQNFRKVIDEVQEFNPDVVFSLNRAGLVKSLIDVISPEAIYITWFIDSYERVPDKLLQFTNKDIVWLTGLEEYAENFCNRYKVDKSQIVFSPFATNTNVFKPDNQERTIDGCLVGTAFSNESFVETLNEIANDVEAREAFLQVFESHKQNYIFDIKQALKDKGYQRYAEKSKEIWQMIFDDQLSIEKRIRFMSALNRFNIKIYGEPNYLWIKYLSICQSSLLNKYQYSPIKTAQDLAALYNISKIGINILHHQASNHSLPIRVFDLMACKTLLITEKTSKNALERIGFKEDIDFVCFENEKDLIDKFDFYLNNDVARETVTASAHLKVEKYHSLKTRIEEGISKSLGQDCVLSESKKGAIEIISSPLFQPMSLSERKHYLRAIKKKFPKTWEFVRLNALRLKILR